MRKISALTSGLLATTFVSFSAHAEPPSFTSLTSAVDYSTAIAAVLLVFAGIAGIAIVWKGGKLILRAMGMS